MNIVQTMLSAGGGGIVQQLASQFGIDPARANAAMSALLPALAGGLRETMESSAGPGVTRLIDSGILTRFADNPISLATPAALNQGRALLSTIFGSEDTGHMVSMVAEKVGLGSGVVASMLPIAATLLAAFVSKDAAVGGDTCETLEQMASGGHNGLMDAVKGLASRILG